MNEDNEDEMEEDVTVALFDDDEAGTAAIGFVSDDDKIQSRAFDDGDDDASAGLIVIALLACAIL